MALSGDNASIWRGEKLGCLRPNRVIGGPTGYVRSTDALPPIVDDHVGGRDRAVRANNGNPAP